MTLMAALVNPFTLDCRDCKAVAGAQCVNGVTGQPLRKALAHACRIHDAEKAQPEEDDESERPTRWGSD